VFIGKGPSGRQTTCGVENKHKKAFPEVRGLSALYRFDKSAHFSHLFGTPLILERKPPKVPADVFDRRSGVRTRISDHGRPISRPEVDARFGCLRKVNNFPRRVPFCSCSNARTPPRPWYEDGKNVSGSKLRPAGFLTGSLGVAALHSADHSPSSQKFYPAAKHSLLIGTRMVLAVGPGGNRDVSFSCFNGQSGQTVEDFPRCCRWNKIRPRVPNLRPVEPSNVSAS